jgi:hypothetical protein
MRPILLLSLFIIGLVFISVPFLDSSPYTITEDQFGVPIVDYGWLMGKKIGERRYPVTIASWADKYYNYYLETGEQEYLDKFLNNVAWLDQNKLETEGFVVFPSDFEYPFYGCKEGWVSAMAQGFALKDYLHAYEVTADEGYLEVAKKVLNSYKVEIEQGGVSYIDPNDSGHWYAEYACNTPPRVLNGFWYALDGLHYYYNKTGDEEARKMYDLGLQELLNHLEEFDRGDWTYYDLEGYPSDETYHPLHVEIMDKLYVQTRNEVFLDYSERWKTYSFSSMKFNYLIGRYFIFKFILLRS